MQVTKPEDQNTVRVVYRHLNLWNPVFDREFPDHLRQWNQKLPNFRIQHQTAFGITEMNPDRRSLKPTRTRSFWPHI